MIDDSTESVSRVERTMAPRPDQVGCQLQANKDAARRMLWV